jgi:GT2 family glycosyltransferase
VRKLILVVGMHRSGVSLLGKILSDLGVSLLTNQTQPDSNNYDGYSETHGIIDIHENLLRELGRLWFSEAGTIALPPNWEQLPATQRAKSQILHVLKKNPNNEDSICAINDPRISIFLPLWKDICDALGIYLNLIHAFRDPREVIASLCASDLSKFGMHPRRAEALWIHYNSEVISNSGSTPRILVDYANWFDTEVTQHLTELSLFCIGEKPSESQRAAIARRIQSALTSNCLLSESTSCLTTHTLSMVEVLTGRQVSKLSNDINLCSPYQSLVLQQLLPDKCELLVFGYGATLCHWSVHQWLERCPLPANFEIVDDSTAPKIGLHLQPVYLSTDLGYLDILRTIDVVLDPNYERVHQLRSLDINAYWLDPLGPSSGWLSSVYNHQLCNELLGLPDPVLLRLYGNILFLGSFNSSWEAALDPSYLCIPDYDRISTPDSKSARLLASWLNAATSNGLQIIRLLPSDYESESMVYSALEQPTSLNSSDWVQPLLFREPVSIEQILQRLSWQQSVKTSALRLETPKPLVHTRYSYECEDFHLHQPDLVAVCISLFNYGLHVKDALSSVLSQTYQYIELIVVDDQSTDGGDEIVLEWMLLNSHRFSRVVLLQHNINSGLAAARNSAFHIATANWCFVLDADNSLYPEAISVCYATAMSSASNVSVVYPLVEVVVHDHSISYSGHLLSRSCWQQERLRHGNLIDAMALVRREHWQHVCGYTHIPDGWEDYDFWCKIIEKGYTGVLFPKKLAVYNQHSLSMQSTKTLRSLSKLEYIMSSRYSWIHFDN